MSTNQIRLVERASFSTALLVIGAVLMATAAVSGPWAAGVFASGFLSLMAAGIFRSRTFDHERHAID
jgi:hypothetical protein